MLHRRVEGFIVGPLRACRFIADPGNSADVVESWRAAFSTVGFANIVGHGIPDEDVREAYASAQSFFHQETQAKMLFNKGEGYGFGGYIPTGVERVAATRSTPDG